MMIATMEITIKKTARSRIKTVDFKNLEFGKYISDHMFVVDYTDEDWKEPQIVPYGNLSLSPATLGLHYGQTVFEGMKAFRMEDNRISLFRPDKHFERFNKSLQRLCMPLVPEDLFITGLHKLIEIDKQWVPKDEEASLYIRPFVFASEERLGVKVSSKYKFIIVTSPVGPYYSKPLRVKVETEFVRAAEGGTGYAKCGGNYGGAFYPSYLAKKQGYDQVLWTDSKEHKYFDEAGTMNLMFVFDGTLVTPPLSTAILDGVTRASILELARDMNVPYEERKVSIAEVRDGIKKGLLKEAFGAGTAATVVPIKTIGIYGKDYDLPSLDENSFMLRVKQQLSDIRTGRAPDLHGWNYII
ncbi:MAG TPA: branched-chain amino acid aminotransferase [Chitinophagales bacterium]|nr:branched-chain amino acid aminotransferase [Chitinophagales bacterium]